MADRSRKKRGRKPKSPETKRTKCVSVRFTESEFCQMSKIARETGKTKGELLHELAVGYEPTFIPPINKKQWIELASLAANFNQFMARINRTNTIDNKEELTQCVREMAETIREIRKSLIGMRSNE